MTKPVLILTRPLPAAQQFAASLSAQVRARVDLIVSPLMSIKPTGLAIDPRAVQGVIFSSSNGVLYGPKGDGRPAYCVGQRTAAAAAAKGWRVEFYAQDAEALIDKVQRAYPPTPLLHLRGEVQRGDIAKRLTDAGIGTQSAVVYTQTVLHLSPAAHVALQSGRTCLAPLFSPRTAARFIEECPDARNTIAIALSPAVADILQGQSFGQVIVASEPSAASVRLTLETQVVWNRLA